MYHNFINITPTVLFKLQRLIVQQMSPLVTVSTHWSLFEFSQQIHDMMMNDNDNTWQIITYSKISNAFCALFCFNIVYYMNAYIIPAVCCAWQDWNYNLWVKHIFPVLLKISGKFPDIFRKIFFCKSYIASHTAIHTELITQFNYSVNLPDLVCQVHLQKMKDLHLTLHTWSK